MKKYYVTFIKKQSFEVEAQHIDEAIENASELYDGNKYAWEGPANQIIVEERKDG